MISKSESKRKDVSGAIHFKTHCVLKGAQPNCSIMRLKVMIKLSYHLKVPTVKSSDESKDDDDGRKRMNIIDFIILQSVV